MYAIVRVLEFSPDSLIWVARRKVAQLGSGALTSWLRVRVRFGEQSPNIGSVINNDSTCTVTFISGLDIRVIWVLR